MSKIDMAVPFKKREQVESSEDMAGLMWVAAKLREVGWRWIIEGEDRGIDVGERRLPHTVCEGLDGVGTRAVIRRIYR